MGIRQRILFFRLSVRSLAFWAVTIVLLPLCSQRVINNSLMLSFLNYALDRSDNLCTARFTKGMSSWSILGEFMLDERKATTLWITGRIALACDNSILAYQSLYPLIERVKNNPLLYQDVVIALAAQGDFQTLESIYQRFPPTTQAISETLALVYTDYTENYETALRFHPGDLYATYHLWRQGMMTADFAQLESYSDTLTHFSFSAISPRNPHLFGYVTRVIPQFFEEGIWSHNKLKSVIEFLIWQSEYPASVADILMQLTSQYPYEPDWSFLLAELYHRQGDLNLAQRYYSRTLFLDDAYAPAYLRLGMVYEALAEFDDLFRDSYQQLARSYYENYYNFAPNDLLGLEKLATLCADSNSLQLLSCNPMLHLDPRQVASELLNVPTEQIALSSNMLPNDGQGLLSKHWHISNMSNYAPFSRALYVVNEDEWLAWKGITPGRVMGLWSAWERGYSQPRAGFWAWNEVLNVPLTIPAVQGERYLILVNYSSTDAKASIWLSENIFDPVKGDIFLPATNGEIRQFAKILSVQTDGEFNCLVRYWGEQSALFYQVGIYKLQSLP